jgi:MHS family alpha-ketoglutarate permease-like MFS transporter
MAETEAFSDAAAARATDAESGEPVWSLITRHRKQMAQVVGITVGITVVYYAWAIAAPVFAMTRGVDKSDALWAGVVANLVFIAALPAWGALSDRIGRKPVSLGCCIALAVAIFPLNAALGDTALQLGVTMSLALVLIAGPASIGPALFAELFPTRIRVMGFGVAYSLAVATFGGTVPYVQTWVASHIGLAAFNGYVVVALLVSAAVVTTLPETRGRSLVHTDAGGDALASATATPV